MSTLECLQAYWWLLISVLGAALVFLLFVQGGQTLLFCSRSDAEKRLIVNSLGRKWETTFTTLVVFGGAFFASFPLFYSTSFGGAYWLWLLILLSFVVQAVSFEFRKKRGNLYGTVTYDLFLLINGVFGCLLLGEAVGMMFFGGDFTIAKYNLIGMGASGPVISQWGPSHGFDVIFNWRCLLLGVAVFFLARTQGALYLLNSVADGEEFASRMRRHVLRSGLIFAVLFVAFLVVLLLQSGYRQSVDGSMAVIENIYFDNLLTLWWCLPVLLIGVVAVLYAIIKTGLSRNFRSGIWFSGTGTVLVVLVLFWIAGYNSTAYLPSTSDAASSLTLANSSSSEFTLKVMSCVSVLVPFVLAYIVYVWRKMNATPLTTEELDSDSHAY